MQTITSLKPEVRVILFLKHYIGKSYSLLNAHSCLRLSLPTYPEHSLEVE